MLQIRLLGQFDVRLDGKRILIPSRAGQSLFAYLALTAGTPHRREKLAGILWPDFSDDNARKNLRHELWRIRKAISTQQSTPVDYLLAEEFTIAFNREADYWLDAAQMERPELDLGSLISNLSLYQGELLPGFYEDWIVLERERIRAIFDTKMEQLLGQLIAAERWTAVQEQAERWLSLGNALEPAYRALMLAYGARGDMPKVSSIYQRCMDELNEQFGLEPSPETRALYDGLLKGAHTPSRAVQSSGTVTFLFTDIEESTNLLDKLGDQYATVLAEHHEILRAAVQKWNGREVDTQGDAFFVTFARSLDAVQCAAEAQRALASHPWLHSQPLRVRMGVHTGEPLIASTGYVGMDVHRAARIGDAAHGGQVLLSQTTRELIIHDLPKGVTIRDLGEHRLKDLKFPTPIYQLVIEGLPRDFPPLRTKFTGSEAPTPGEPPFKGLQYFDEIDSDLFFGRELLTAKLVNRLRETEFLSVVIGASGSGKSSLVRAGLIPALKKGEMLPDGTKPPEGSADWRVYVITPTAHPLQALATELTRESESVTAAATLMDDLMQDPRSLSLFLNRQNPKGHTLLALDQFEELFTLCHDEFEREAFIDNLLTTLNQSKGNTTLILTLRADFYAHLAQYPELRDAVAKQQEYIGPMTTEELRRAIEEPAKRGHWVFEPGLVDLILRDVGDEPGALPLLSHALLETWKRRAGHTLTLKGYADAGGVRGAIAHTAESIYQNLSSEEQGIARNIFLRLTELGEGTEDTRRRASLDELLSQADAEHADEVRSVLNTLAEAKLVTLGEDTAEVAHEALIREWPALREWLNQDRESLRLHRHLTEAAHEWELLERDAGALYRGSHLVQAREWAVLHPKALNAGERIFLEASNVLEQNELAEREAQLQRELEAAQKLAETQRQSASHLRTRNRVITTVGTIAVILALLAGMFGLKSNQNAVTAQNNAATAQVAKDNAINAQATAEAERLRAENEKQIAFSRELASAAIENLTVDPQRSILLALHALSESHTQEAETALHRAVITSRLLQTSSMPDFEFFEVAFSPDGARVVTSGCESSDCDNTFNSQVRDAESLEVLFTLPGIFASKTWSEANGLVTINYADDPNTTLVTLWDNQGEIISATILPIAFADTHGWETSLDRTREATLTGNGLITVWDLTTGQKLQAFHQAEGSEITFLAFSPDGKHLLLQPNRFSQFGWDGETIVLDIASGQEIISYPIHGHSAFAPDGKRIAMLSDRLSIWDLASGQKLFDLHQEAQFPLNDIRFSPDGTLLATVMKNGKAEIWDATTGDNQLILPGIARDPCALAISPDNSRVLVVTCVGHLQLWGISSEYSREWLTLPDEGGNVSVSPDGKRLATRGSSANAVSVRDADSGQLQLTLTGHTDVIWDLAFSPDGTRLVTASFDKTAKVWDTGTGIEILTLEGHTDALWSVAYSPNGDQIATIGYDKTARLWDADSGHLLFTLDAYSEPVSYTTTIGVAFSPDGRNLATAGSGPLKIWDTTSGKMLLTLQLSGEKAACVAYSPDGKYLAIGMAGGPASVWEIASGHKLFDLPDHTATVVDIAFSPDGTHIATTSTDRTVKVWDAVTGQLQLTLPDHNPFANALAFSPDGTRLTTASDGFGGIRVWALDLDNLVQIARSRLTRELTTEECRQYLHMEQCPAES